MSNVGQILDSSQNRPSYVRFERVPVEDVPASKAAGHYVAKDLDYALVTPAGSKDVFKCKVPQWFANLKQDVENGRLPPEWLDKYTQAYASWLAGQEPPLDGTPIRGWGVLSPAQQETLTRLHILTVEDLARMNDEAIRRIGMGAMDLKHKAVAWLAQLQDKGPLTQEVAALKAENALLKANLESLGRAVADLKAGVEDEPSADISAADILEDDMAAAYKAKFGRKPHPNMKPENLREAVAA